MRLLSAIKEAHDGHLYHYQESYRTDQALEHLTAMDASNTLNNLEVVAFIKMKYAV